MRRFNGQVISLTQAEFDALGGRFEEGATYVVDQKVKQVGGSTVSAGGGVSVIGQRAVTFGDSTAALTYSAVTAANVADAVVVSGGVATMKLAVALIGGVGDRIQVIAPTSLAASDQSNTNYNTTITQVIDTTTIRFTARGLADGTYAGQVAGSSWQLNLIGSFRDTEWITGVEMFSPAPCVFVGNYAVGGSLSSNILPPLSKCFQPGEPDFDVAYVSTGYNNIAAATGANAAAYATSAFAAARQVIADLDTFVKAMKEKGKQVRAGIPAGASPANSLLTYRQEAQQAFLYLRKLMYGLQRKHANLYLVDWMANCAAGSGVDAGYMAKPYEVGDGVHPSIAAQYHNGRLGAAQLRAQGAFSSIPWAPISALDDALTYANTRASAGNDYANAIPNGLMSGSAAVTGTNIQAGSTAPTSWSFFGAPTNGTVESVADRDIILAPGEVSNRAQHGRGWDLKFTATGASGTQSRVFIATPNIVSALTPGRWYRVEMTMYVKADCAHYWGHGIQVYPNDGVQRLPKRRFSNAAARATLKAGDLITITGGLIYIPSTITWTTVNIYISFEIHDGGVLDIQLSRARFEPVDIELLA